MPGSITSLFFTEFAIIGTKGGEQIKAVDVTIVVSLSILNIADNSICNPRVPKIVNPI